MKTKFFSKQDFGADLFAGFIVFLIALPLSLGIAMASGVPPIAGLIAAAMGGLLVSRINGSNVTINGPAAGLIVVVLSGVERLGQGDPWAGYRAFLAATVVAGIALFLLGSLGAGALVDFVPSSVVHGMLAGIGVIIFSKQAHLMLGATPAAKAPLALLAEIPRSLGRMNPEIAIIGLVSLAILILLPKVKAPWVRRIPAPLVAVLAGCALGRLFDLEHEHQYLLLNEHNYTIGPRFLVTLPAKILDGFTMPEWSRAGSLTFVSVTFTLIVIQGLETLLSAAAVDRLDPLKRRSDLNRDLRAVGLGSAASAMIGGLPMIAEIVRSRANVDNGGRTGRANFFHGLFIASFVVLVPGLLHLIPLASLAAILVVTGWRLASPSQFRHTLAVGRDQLAVFAATCFMCVATDLLIGVVFGVLLEISFHIGRGAKLKDLFRARVHVEKSENDSTYVRIEGVAAFTNIYRIQKTLRALQASQKVTVDLGSTRLVDHTAMERIREFEHETDAEVAGLDAHRAPSAHPLATKYQPAR